MAEMFLSRQLKGLAKKALACFGVGIHRLKPCAEPPPFPNAQGLPVCSVLDHNSQARINEFYSDPKIVERYLARARLKSYEDVAALLREKGIDCDGKSVADVGCGTGHFLLNVRKRFRPSAMTGFEYAEAALRVARETLPEAQFQLLDIYEGTARRFDVVFCIEVIEHLLQPEKALKNLLAMLGENGVLLITVPDGRQDTFAGHINFWSPESWQVFVRSNCSGFDTEMGTVFGNANFAIIRSRRSQTKK